MDSFSSKLEQLESPSVSTTIKSTPLWRGLLPILIGAMAVSSILTSILIMQTDHWQKAKTLIQKTEPAPVSSVSQNPSTSTTSYGYDSSGSWGPVEKEQR